MLVALISAIDGLSLLYQRLQTKLHYGFVDILGPWLQYIANLCFSTANTPPITPVESCYLFATGLSYFPLFLLSDCRFLPDCRFPFVFSPPFFPSFYFADCRFSFRLISGLPFLPDCRFSLRHIAWLSFLIFTGLTLFPSSYCRIVVLFTGLSLFPSSYYRCSLRLITN